MQAFRVRPVFGEGPNASRYLERVIELISGESAEQLMLLRLLRLFRLVRTFRMVRQAIPTFIGSWLLGPSP